MQDQQVAEEFVTILDYDAETGVLRYKNGKEAGSTCTNYRRLKYKGKYFKGHRLAWFMHYGEWPSAMIDHIDGDTHNNRIANLRLADHSTNSINAGARSNSTTGVRGVKQKRDGKYEATIWKDYKSYYLGVYTSLEEAARIRRLVERVLYGEFSPHAGKANKNLVDDIRAKG